MSESKLFRILSIDGGGIRGIIPGCVLVTLEEKLQKKAGDPKVRIADYFDMVAGTSTGGILSCILLCPGSHLNPTRPRFTAKEAVALYLEKGDSIFSVPTLHRIRSLGGLADEKYPADGLEKSLREYFTDLRLSELLRPTVITAYDIKRRNTFFFKQHLARVEGSSNPGRDFLVRDVARATSAAPTYFEVPQIESLHGVPYPLVDGGIFANNPSLCAYAEARKSFDKTAAKMCILSLGTGSSNTAYDYDQAKDWGLAGWAKPAMDIMMSAVSETVHYQLNEIYEAVQKPEQYLRIDADLAQETDSVSEMDNVEPENLKILEGIGKELTLKFDKQLDAIVDLLV